MAAGYGFTGGYIPVSLRFPEMVGDILSLYKSDNRLLKIQNGRYSLQIEYDCF